MLPRLGSVLPRLGCARHLAMGPASGGEVSDEMLDKLSSLSTQALIDGLWVMGWPSSFIEGARPLGKGQKCAGRAVTLNFVPHRPDIAADKPAGPDSPEYEAFEKCGPRNVLVMASVGPWESVGGDIKFLRLKQLGVGGLVTDGSVRDTDEMLAYGFPVFSYSTTAKQGPAFMQPWECNGVIECGGVVVRPGDAIVGDQDGVVVVPAAVADKVYEIAHGREVVEGVIKEELIKNPGPPGKYYPFKPPIKPESPLGQLLTSKGIKFHHTSAGPHRRNPSGLAGPRRGLAAYPGLHKDPYYRSPEDLSKVIGQFAEHRACAVLRTPSKELTFPAMEAAVLGGFKLAEFTLTTPGCLDTLADFRSKYDGKALVGCGTILDVADAKKALDAGAQFIIAPVFVPEVVTWCATRNILIAPGCQTPSEAFAAYKAGAQIQKIFPGVANGHMWVKAVSAALPMLSLNPTSGVDLDNAGDFLNNGAFGVGLVAPLFPPDKVAAKDWDAIKANAEKVIGNVKKAGPGPKP